MENQQIEQIFIMNIITHNFKISVLKSAKRIKNIDPPKKYYLFGRQKLKTLRFSFINIQISNICQQVTYYNKLNKMQSEQEYEKQIEDPFLAQGGSIIYQGRHKFIICIQQKPQTLQKLPNPQILLVKMGVQQQNGNPKNIRIQLTSDSDLYFNFVFGCNDWQFKRVREKQNFYIEFREYAMVIIKNLQKLSQPNNKYSALFTIFSQTEGKMDLIRHSEFKDDNIMSFDFVKEKENTIKDCIQFRYDLMRYQYRINTQNYQEISEIVKSKNPSLMMQINKTLRKK